MKKYIKSTRLTYESEYNRNYAGRKPSTKCTVEDVGECIGDMHVFCITCEFDSGPETKYFVGELPNQNINFVGTWATELSKLQIDPSSYSSDTQLIHAVTQIFLNMVHDPASQCVFDFYDIDPLNSDWHIFEDTIYIRNYDIITSVGDDKFYPSKDGLFRILVHGGQIDEQLRRYFPKTVKAAEKKVHDYLKSYHKDKAVASKPYPYDADDSIVDAALELKTFILSTYANDLSSAQQEVEAKSVNNRRSTRYNDPNVQKQIDDIYAWADDNHLNQYDLREVVNEIYKIYWAKQHVNRYDIAE